MERKIGEIFERYGEWYQCVKSDGTCNGCAGKFRSNSFCYGFKECVGKIFKKLEEVGEPFSNEHFGLVQKYELKRYGYSTKDKRVCFVDGYDVFIKIKQNKEDMEEKNNGSTPLNVLTDKYVNGDICYDDFEKEVKTLYSCKGEIKPTLKEFDLEAAKAGKPVCTRDGRKARIICFDKQEGFPIIALVETKVNDRISEEIALFNINGRAVSDDIDSKLDLMMLPEKKEGWVNLYDDIPIYDTKEEALSRRSKIRGLIDTIKVSWEE